MSSYRISKSLRKVTCPIKAREIVEYQAENNWHKGESDTDKRLRIMRTFYTDMLVAAKVDPSIKVSVPFEDVMLSNPSNATTEAMRGLYSKYNAKVSHIIATDPAIIEKRNKSAIRQANAILTDGYRDY